MRGLRRSTYKLPQCISPLVGISAGWELRATAQEGKVFAKVEIPTFSVLKTIQATCLFLITFINFSCIVSHRQAALEITARYCGRELEQYGQCVAAKPESWQRDCHHLKMSIAQCTSAHPVIRQIRQACSEPFEAFEECLRQNEAAVGNCAEHVRRFLQCAEQNITGSLQP
ncbi:hypothetical protein MJT46_018884 [Ovis ammon polii x Ovis aries]|nr:hypothetical protein MJT46_018884 [Ovis ammon polii x Ovis aries]